MRLKGFVTGEHGLGVEKRAYLPVMFNSVDMQTSWTSWAG
jgi:hypothetical protein